MGKEETTFTLISGKWSTIFTLPLRGMPLKQPSEETGDADACNEEKKRKEKDESFFYGKPPLKKCLESSSLCNEMYGKWVRNFSFSFSFSAYTNRE